MKKIIIILSILFTQLCAFAQTTEQKLLWPNGNTQAIGMVDAKGQRTGQWKFYYENGNLQTEGSYSNGKQNGEVKDYDEVGGYCKGLYMNGKINGDWKCYDKKGNLSRTGRYENGHAVGKWTMFYENGKPYLINFYDNNGNITLEKIEYYEDGKINYFSKYNKQKKLVTKFYNKKGKLIKTLVE